MANIPFTPAIDYDTTWDCVVLRLKFTPLKPKILDFKGRQWRAKTELHCTLISPERLATILTEQVGTPQPELAKKLLDGTRDFVQQHPFTQADVQVMDDIRTVAEDDARSIVRMVTIAGIDTLFATLSSSVGYDVPPHPSHVTIYTADGRGIGIQTPDKMAAVATQLTLTELAEFKRLTNIDEVLA